jgi:hypothetical protein
VVGGWLETLLYYDNLFFKYKIMKTIWNLLNLTQEYKSKSNSFAIHKKTLEELKWQKEAFEKNIKILLDNIKQTEEEIQSEEVDNELIKSQLDVAYIEAKQELEEISNFDNTDNEYENKIQKEQFFIQKLNVIEWVLGIDKTPIPERRITSEIKDDTVVKENKNNETLSDNKK